MLLQVGAESFPTGKIHVISLRRETSAGRIE